MRLCRRFVNDYPDVVTQGADQVGEESFYPRRRPEDSDDPHKSIAEQFNLFSVLSTTSVTRHIFDLKGHRYFLKIERE